VGECIDAYLKLSKDVSNVDQVLARKIPIGDNQCRFDHNVLEGAIKLIIKERLNDESCRMNAVPKALNKTCPTFVVAKKALHVDAPPTIFRTYGGEGVSPSKLTLWEAVRTTSAAPSFFKLMFIDIPRPGMTYVDGGLGYNNPSHVALDEARRIWPTSKYFSYFERPVATATVSELPLELGFHPLLVPPQFGTYCLYGTPPVIRIIYTTSTVILISTRHIVSP
jgi:Patatin-like phospholipase